MQERVHAGECQKPAEDSTYLVNRKSGLGLAKIFLPLTIWYAVRLSSIFIESYERKTKENVTNGH